MFKHNILISLRSFRRFKTTFFINLVGLSTGMACAILIFLWVSDELSVDRFHADGDQLYRVEANVSYSGFEFHTNNTSPLLGPALAEDLPEVEESVQVLEHYFRKKPGVIKTEDATLQADELYVTPEFFTMFTFDYVEGEASLPGPDAMLISQSLARQLFPDEVSAVGQTISWKQERGSGDYRITGVFEDTPDNSSLQFDVLLGMNVYAETDSLFYEWFNQNPNTYVKLKEGADPEQFKSKLKDYLLTKIQDSSTTLQAQKYGDSYLYGIAGNTQPWAGRILFVYIFGLIAVLILGIAAINFMNMATAKAANRSKEIGVKMSIGARKSNLVSQFLTESMLLSFLALCLAVLFVALLLPQFNTLTDKSLTLSPSLWQIGGFVAIAIITGILAGSYPAFYLSAQRPSNVLVKQGRTNAILRKGLVVFQFTISGILMVIVLVIGRQVDFIQSKDLGFERKDVLQLDFPAQNPGALTAFMREAQQLPGVLNVTGSNENLMSGFGMTTGVDWEGRAEDDMEPFATLETGYNFVQTLGMEILEGRAFNEERDAGRRPVILNEAAVLRTGIGVGDKISLFGGPAEVVGIVKDFHYSELYQEIRPVILHPNPALEQMMVRIHPENKTQTIAALSDLFAKHQDGLPLDFTYLEDSFEEMYATENRMSRLSSVFSGMSILISCLGLLGLAAYAAEKRRKEISIRKVMGASTSGITLLISKEFTRLIFISLVIALPCAYYLVDLWMKNFHYKADITAEIFIIPVLLIFALVWGTVIFSTFRTVRVNPAESLRNE